MLYALIAVSVACAVLVGRDVVTWVFQKDSEVEARRRAAFHLAGTLKAYGLKRMPDFLGDYAVGDYSGMYEKIHDFAKLVLSGEDAVVKELEGAYESVLTAKMASEEGRALISAKLAAVEAKAAEAKPAEVKPVAAKSA
jgi:hypothetical protein